MRHHLLRRLAHQEGQKLLGRGRIVRGFQRRRSGDVHEAADVAAGEVMDGARHLVGARLHAEPRPVVVVDDPGRRGAALDRRRHALVVIEDRRVLSQALQPFQRGRAALERDDGADQRQKVRIGRGDRDLALPFGLGEIEEGPRQVRFLDHPLVVGEHVLAGENADPVAVRAAVGRRDARQSRRRHLRQEALFRQELQLRRILGEKDVRRRRRALLHELARKLRPLAVADLDVDAGFLGERLREQVDRLLMLRRVKRQGDRARRDRPGRDEQSNERQRRRGAFRGRCGEWRGRSRWNGMRLAPPTGCAQPSDPLAPLKADRAAGRHDFAIRAAAAAGEDLSPPLIADKTSRFTL